MLYLQKLNLLENNIKGKITLFAKTEEGYKNLTKLSSLSYLKDFPIDKLKIDQSFISNLADHDGDDAKIANLVIDLGHKLGLEVVAEGVETQNQIDFLRKYACDEIQGFILSKPIEINEFENLINTHSN